MEGFWRAESSFEVLRMGSRNCGEGMRPSLGASDSDRCFVGVIAGAILLERGVVSPSL